MKLFVFEPNDRRRLILEREIEKAGLRTYVIREEFFETSLGILRNSEVNEHAVLIGDTAETKKYIRAVRRAGCNNPLIVIYQQKDPDIVAEVLNCGADDVVISPFTGYELASRIASIVRRSNGYAAESISIGEVTVFFDGRDPLVSGVPLSLSKREHDIFLLLAMRYNKLISKNSIYDAIYGMSADQPYDKVIDVYICKIRKKISRASESGFEYIQTVRGRGYKFRAPERLSSTP